VTPASALEVQGLTVTYPVNGEIRSTLAEVSLQIRPGEILGIVGRSGAGKTVLATALANAVAPPGRIVAGEVRVLGTSLLGLTEDELRKIRGRVLGSIVPNPRSHLNPMVTVGRQLGAVYDAHHKTTRAQRRERVLDMLRLVGMPAPKERFDAYPHQLSGGMAQRCLIAMALICEPQVLLADEPTSGLDVTIQDQILRMFRKRALEQGAACLLVTRDMGIVSNFCDRVAVLDQGRIIETAAADTFIRDAREPISRELIAASSYESQCGGSQS
jgi:ABC-type dipeptide/oligopeptide/nickel transport system ATPase component